MRLKLLVIFLFSAFVFLQYRLWFDAGGVKTLLALKHAIAKQKEINEALKKHNEELLFQVERIENSEDAAEYRARNELGMIKKGELFYQVIKKNNVQVNVDAAAPHLPARGKN